MMPGNEESLLLDLKTKLKNHRRLVSLKVLCARKVADLRPMYAKLSSVLPKTLCSLVYQEFFKQYESINYETPLKDDWRNLHSDLIKEKVHLFAGDELDEFDCRILQLDKKLLDFRQPFKQLAKGSPKLRCLKDNRCDYTSNRDNKLLLFEFYSLQTMASLVILDISFYPARDADLHVIGTCLPLLQRLRLFALTDLRDGGICISIEGLQSLTNLKKLKCLSFEGDDCITRSYIELVKNCLLLMPKVNTWASGCVDGEDYTVANEFPFYKDPVELGLEHLVLGESTVIPSNVTLPNVTRITVLKKLTISLKQFEKLSHLFIENNMDWSHSQLRQTLSEIGHLLKKLKLSFFNSCDLLQVLQLCPNLEDIVLHEMYFVDNFCAFQLRNNVQKLKVFKIIPEPSFQVHYEDYPGLLHLLLTSCPELEQLEFIHNFLSEEEIDLIIEDMDAGALTIQKLNTVDIFASLDEETVLSFIDFACKFCFEKCNTLKKVRIDICNYEEYEDELENIFPEVKLALKMQHYINTGGADWPH